MDPGLVDEVQRFLKRVDEVYCWRLRRKETRSIVQKSPGGMAEPLRSSTMEQDFGDNISTILGEGEALRALRVGGSSCEGW